MLGINNKHTVSCSLAEGLQAYIDSNYTKEEADAVRGKVLDVERLRDTVVKTLVKPEVTLNDLKVLENYHHTLMLVTSRFPFGDMKKTGGGWFSKAKVGSVKCTFTYSEAFKEKKKVTEFDDQFEQACVSFNLAAVTSQVALALKKQDDLKEACTMYRTAAGILSHISNNPAYTAFGNLSVDLQKNSLDYFAAVMLAQAQACFVEMAIVQKKSPDLISKLAQGTCQLYKTAVAALTGELKDMLGRYDYSWPRHMLHQQHCFNACSLFFRAKTCYQLAEEGDAKQFGVEIGYLQAALRAITDAVRTSSGLNASAIQSRAALEEQIQDRLKKATKENDVIYFSSIPKLDQLDDIESKVVVTPLMPVWATPAALATPQAIEDDPFARLVPAKVHEDAKLFEGRVGDLLRRVSEEARDDTGRLNGMLASMGLPAAIQVMQKDSGLPPKLWGDIREVQLKGGVQAIAEAQERVMQAAGGCLQLHTEIKKKLAEEHKDDDEARARFGVRWNRRPSPQITADLLKMVDTIDGYFARAREADDKISQEWNDSLEKMAILEMTREQIEATMPSMPDSHFSQKSQAIATLEALLVAVNDLINKRDATVRQLAQAASNLSIVPLLMNKDAKLKSFDQICNEGLQPLKTIEAQLQQLKAQQAELLQQIHAANETFTRTRTADPVLEARQQVLQNLNTSVECWNRLMKNLNEGLKFYLELSSTKLEPLRLNVEDYVVARDLEKATILGQLTHEFARLGAAAGGGAASNPNLYGPSSNPAYNLPSSPLPSQHPSYPADQGVKMHVAQPAAGYQPNQYAAQPTYASSYPSYNTPSYPPNSPQPTQAYPASAYGATPYQQPQQYQPFTQQPSYTPQPAPTNPFSPNYPKAQPASYGGNPFGPAPSQSYGIPTAAPQQSNNQWACSACTFLNNVGATKCSICGTAK